MVISTLDRLDILPKIKCCFFYSAKESIFCKLIFKIKLSVREDIKKEVKRLGTIAKGRLGGKTVTQDTPLNR